MTTPTSTPKKRGGAVGCLILLIFACIIGGAIMSVTMPHMWGNGLLDQYDQTCVEQMRDQLTVSGGIVPTDDDVLLLAETQCPKVP